MNYSERHHWHNQILAHCALTPAAKIVLLALETFVDYHNGANAHPGIEQLMDRCALSRTAVQDALRAGRRLGLIEQTARANPKAGLTAVYRLCSIPATTGVENGFKARDDGPRTDIQGPPTRPQNEFQGPEIPISRPAYAAPTTTTPPKDSSSHLQRVSYVGSATTRDNNGLAVIDDTWELATSERGNDLSPPVSIGATRLVAAIIGDKFSDADRTVLRIKASEAHHAGRSDDDIVDCLRWWLTKPHLGPHALLCGFTEIDKRKHAGPELSTSEKNVLKAQALKARMTRKELHA